MTRPRQCQRKTICRSNASTANYHVKHHVLTLTVPGLTLPSVSILISLANKAVLNELSKSTTALTALEDSMPTIALANSTEFPENFKTLFIIVLQGLRIIKPMEVDTNLSANSNLR